MPTLEFGYYNLDDLIDGFLHVQVALKDYDGGVMNILYQSAVVATYCRCASNR